MSNSDYQRVVWGAVSLAAVLVVPVTLAVYYLWRLAYQTAGLPSYEGAALFSTVGTWIGGGVLLLVVMGYVEDFVE